MNIGLRLKKLRTERNISMRELAEKLGVTHAHISKVESSKVSPSVDFLQSAADFFGKHISYFFIEGSSFNDTEKALLFEKDLSLENIKEKYPITIDNKPASDEEIAKMIEHVRILRQIDKMYNQ